MPKVTMWTKRAFLVHERMRSWQPTFALRALLILSEAPEFRRATWQPS